MSLRTGQGTASHDDVIDVADEKALTQPDSAPEKHLHHPGLTERVASFGRSTMGQLALCLLFGAFIAAAIVFVTPTDAVPVAKQVLVLADADVARALAGLRRRARRGVDAPTPGHRGHRR